MEQMTLPFAEPEAQQYAIRVSVDDSPVPLSEEVPTTFDSEDDALTYLASLKTLLEESGFGIHLDTRPYGWVGLQKLSDGSHIWRGEVQHLPIGEPK